MALEDVTKLTLQATSISKVTIYRLCRKAKSGEKLVILKKMR
jgi:hypothetical protein